MGYEQALELRADILRNLSVVQANWKGMVAEKVSDMYRLDDAMMDHLLNERSSAGVRDGDPYYWSPEMSSMLETVARSMPSWTMREEALASESGFVYFASPLRLAKHHADSNGIRAISYQPSKVEMDGERGVAISFWLDTTGVPGYGRLSLSHGTFWSYGMSLDEKFEIYDDEAVGKPGLKDCARYFAAALALMEQTIVIKRPERAPRSTRKRLGEIGETPIQVVRLRRTERSGGAVRDGEKAYELTCQFVVRMHWRQHYYPSDGSHRPLLIAPYMKGPEGTPLKVQADRIFVVDR